MIKGGAKISMAYKRNIDDDRQSKQVNNENEFLNQKAVFELFSNCVMII